MSTTTVSGWGSPIAPPPITMTRENFLAWDRPDTRAEWVDGEVFVMSPVTHQHDDLQGWLNALLRFFVEHRDLGRVFGPELLVEFTSPPSLRLPDLGFVRRENVDCIQRNRVTCVPDMLVEVVSRDSVARDYREKYLAYQQAGVREYWIIDAPSERFDLHLLGETGIYELQQPDVHGRLHSRAIAGFWLKPPWLWQQELPKLHTVLREMGVLS